MLWLSYLVAIALYASAFAAYKQAEVISGNKPLLLLATLASTAALITLLVYAYGHNSKAILVFGVFMLVSVAFELIYGRLVRKHFLQHNS